jgi:hypothetical protein
MKRQRGTGSIYLRSAMGGSQTPIGAVNEINKIAPFCH